jgi:hypothetical protein
MSTQINTPDTMLMKSSDAISWVFQPIPAEFGTNIWWKGAAEATVPVVRFKQEIVMIEDAAASTNVALSADGATFDQVVASEDGAERGIAFAPNLGTQGRFCSVGASGKISISDDAGQTWTIQTSPAPAANYRVVEWFASLGLFLAGADDLGANNIVTSPDGIDWTQRTAADFRARDFADDGTGNIVCVGEKNLAGQEDCYFSDDGITWTITSGAASSTGLGVAVVVYDAFRNRFMLIDQNEEVFITTDLGANWTNLNSNLEGLPGVNVNHIGGSDIIQIPITGRIICTVTTGVVISDDGGLTWVEQLDGWGQRRGIVRLDNGHLVSCGSGTNRNIIHSFDNGTTWLIGSDPLGATSTAFFNMAVGNVTEVP